MSENGESLVEYTLSFNPFWIYFTNSNSDHTFWKLHDYKFRSSDTVTTGQESAVEISVTENQCLSMYVSVDKNCFLDITLELNGENITKTVIGFNEIESFKKWQRIEIQTKSAGNGKLSFYRGFTQTGLATGYWAVDDITFCNGDTKVNQMVIEDKSVNEYRCKPLKKSSTINTDNILLCDNPGYLGKNCNVSCSEVLGKSISYCENYKICQEGANCYCSWGYQGAFCETPCRTGTWGLFCKNRCKAECSDCHRSTGQCPNSSSHEEILTTKSTIENVLTEENLPESIILDSNKILIAIPENRKINNSITYHVKYSCVSPWCANQVVKEDNNTIIPPSGNKKIMTSEFKQMNPFTTYQPEVTVKMLNQSINKKYDEIKPKLGYLPVANQSVYSRNGTTLWIRFQQPDATVSPSQFRIWYLRIAFGSKSPPNYQSTLTQCPLWDDYICGRIDNLEPDTLYSIILEAKESDDQKWALSAPISGLTNEEAPQAPENLDVKWVSDHEAILTWDHPSVTNGPLKKFEVEVEAGGVTESYVVPVENHQKTYQWTIPVNYSTMYSIKVWASNRFVGDSSDFTAIAFPPNPELSSLAVVATCFTSCYLLIPKPKNLGYYSTYDILVLHENETEENIIAKLKKLKSDSGTDINGWLVTELEDHNEKIFRINIDDVPENKVSILEKNYYLILSDNRDQYVVYPITQDNSVESGGLLTERNVIMLSTLSLSILLVIISLLMLLLYYRKRLHRRSLHMKTKPNSSDSTKDRVLLLSGYESFTRIGKHRFAHFLKNVLQGPKHFKDEFHSLPVSTKPIVHGFAYKNVSKNRNQDYLPCNINNI